MQALLAHKGHFITIVIQVGLSEEKASQTCLMICFRSLFGWSEANCSYWRLPVTLEYSCGVLLAVCLLDFHRSRDISSTDPRKSRFSHLAMMCPQSMRDP